MSWITKPYLSQIAAMELPTGIVSSMRSKNRMSRGRIVGRVASPIAHHAILSRVRSPSFQPLVAYSDVLSTNQDMKSHTDWYPLSSSYADNHERYASVSQVAGYQQCISQRAQIFLSAVAKTLPVRELPHLKRIITQLHICLSFRMRNDLRRCFQQSIDRSTTDTQLPTNLFDTGTVGFHLTQANSVDAGRSPFVFSCCFRFRNTLHLTFPTKVRLKLCEHRKHIQKALTRSGAGINRLFSCFQQNTFFSE